MSEAGGRQRAREEYACASGAKPRPEGRVRERGRRPTMLMLGVEMQVTEAARRRAIVRARRSTMARHGYRKEGA